MNFFFVFMVRSSLLVGVGINRESDWLSLVDGASRMEDAFPFGGSLRFFFFYIKKTFFFGCSAPPQNGPDLLGCGFFFVDI